MLGAGTAASCGPLLAFALASRRRVWSGNGAELLFDGAQVGHQCIQVHRVALVQRLCREQRLRIEEDEGAQQGEGCDQSMFLTFSFLTGAFIETL